MGLVADTETTITSGTAERKEAKTMERQTILKKGAALGADKGYDVEELLQAMRKGVSSHSSRVRRAARLRWSNHPALGLQKSLKIRKRIEEVFGWTKTVDGLRKAKFRGLERVKLK